MKRLVVYAILALCATVAVPAPLMAQPESAPSGPKAVVEEPLFDAGKVAKGEDVVHDFVIRNEGDAPLNITDVRPACGCTVAEYDALVPAGGTGKVHVVVETDTFDGGISKGVTVLTDDPQNPRLVLTVKVLVKPLVLVRPGFARFIQPQLSEPGVVEQILFTEDFPELKVLDVKSPYPFLKVDYRKATDEEKEEKGVGNQWVLTLTLDYDEAPVGALAEYVHVVTNHPQQKDVPIPVSGFVRPMVVLTPERANLGSVSISDEPTTATMLLKNYARQDLDVSVAENTVPGLKVSVEPVREGREYKIVLTLGQDLPMGDFDGIIRLNLNHPKKKSLEIPVHGTRI